MSNSLEDILQQRGEQCKNNILHNTILDTDL